jgi:hypothetical protein
MEITTMADSQPTASNPFSAIADELHTLVCDSGSAHDVLEDLIALMEASANECQPIATVGFIRLAQAVADDLGSIHGQLDHLWMRLPLSAKAA